MDGLSCWTFSCRSCCNSARELCEGMKSPTEDFTWSLLATDVVAGGRFNTHPHGFLTRTRSETYLRMQKAPAAAATAVQLISCVHLSRSENETIPTFFVNLKRPVYTHY